MALLQASLMRQLDVIESCSSSLGIVKGPQAVPEQEPGGKLLEAMIWETSSVVKFVVETAAILASSDGVRPYGGH